MEDEIKELGKDMTPILLEDLGMKFPTEKSKRKRRYGLYQCQYCGKEWETITPSIKKETQSLVDVNHINIKTPWINTT